MLESYLRNVKKKMSQTIVMSSLLITKKKLTKHYREEDFCLGRPGWCSCSDCASFSLDTILHLEAINVETRYNKSLKRKRIEVCEAIKSTQQECSNTQMTADDMNKLEIKAEKENFDHHFPFDTLALLN